jgi:hypothetical protein
VDPSTTSTTSRDAYLAERKIAETWSRARLETLVRTHRTALDLLADRGVRAGPVSADSAVDVAARVHDPLGEPARRNKRETARRLRDNLAANRHEGLAPLAAQPGLDARIALIRSV